MRWLIFSIISLYIMACQVPPDSQSKLFEQIFSTEEGLFRSVQLGMQLSQIRQLEPSLPTSQDLLGLTFSYPLPDSQQLFVEYYNGLSANGQPQDSLRAIIANVFLKDELTAAELYQEIQGELSQEFGLSIGEFGQDVWESETAAYPIEVGLKLHTDGRSLSISFIALDQ